jgi:hypothetical protein
MLRTFHGLLAAAVLACPASIAESLDAGGELPLGTYVGALRTVPLEINGRAATMIFDTGAGITSVTPEFARRIGCTPGAPVTAFRMEGERVSLARCASLQVRVAGIVGTRELGVLDLRSLLPPDLPPVDGVAGLDLFDGRAITILPRLGSLRVETASTLRRATKGLRSARLRLSREAGGMGLTAFVPARTPAGVAWLLLDSANLAGVRLHPWVFDALAGSGTAEPKLVTLSIEGADAETVEASRVDALIYDGALDAEYLARHSFTLDLRQGRVWWRSVSGGVRQLIGPLGLDRVPALAKGGDRLVTDRRVPARQQQR